MIKNKLNVLPPELSSEWEVLEVIRSSSNSQVYKVTNINSDCGKNNIKIIKEINEKIFDKNVYDIVRKINDIHIQNITNIIHSQSCYYIIMEYLPNLTHIICNNGITGDDIFNIVIDISIALNILHKNNVLHLDCTPDNIYKNIDGSYCLGDFSSAIILNNKSNNKISGTNGFIPPETLNGYSPTFLSDEFVYSSLIYTLFNDGYSPDTPYIDNITQNISSELYSIILKGCSVNPSDRYESINSMYNEIDEIMCSYNEKEKNYLLIIDDETHPLYYLKTSNIEIKNTNSKINTKSNLKSNKIKNKKIDKIENKTNNKFSIKKSNKNNNDKHISENNIKKTSNKLEKIEEKNCNSNNFTEIEKGFNNNNFIGEKKEHVNNNLIKENNINESDIKDTKKFAHRKYKYIKNIVFIAIATSIFVFSYYNYVYKPEHENQLSESEIENLIDFNESIKDSDIFNSDNKNNSNDKFHDEDLLKDNIPNITEYDISNIGITKFPDNKNKDFKCDIIKCLYADINKISSLDNIEYYTSLNELYISDNNITDLTPLEELKDLKILVVSYNNIKDLVPICYLTSLTNLDLSGNKNLTNICELISLHHLKTLNVTNTNITKEEIEFLTINLPNCIILY